ncbi:hypothetical protein INT48_001566, partial [Thamnidium elegans]
TLWKYYQNHFFSVVYLIYVYHLVVLYITKTVLCRGEKKDKDSAIVVFYVNKNKSDTRLTLWRNLWYHIGRCYHKFRHSVTDGIGSAFHGNNCMVIESSG